MLQDRITRVINNHQYSCAHTSHYLYVLKGFQKVLNDYTVPVDFFNLDSIKSKKNMAVLYEDASLLPDDVVSLLNEYDYDIWIVDFNFFEEGYLATKVSSVYESDADFMGEFLISYKPIPWTQKRKTLNIFNTINSLRGLNVDETLNDIQRYNMLFTK
ncbi:MAG: hypothetical protein RR565_06520 [Erysipelothrix sp.]